jgi:hypothetical protein
MLADHTALDVERHGASYVLVHVSTATRRLNAAFGMDAGLAAGVGPPAGDQPNGAGSKARVSRCKKMDVGVFRRAVRRDATETFTVRHDAQPIIVTAHAKPEGPSP